MQVDVVAQLCRDVHRRGRVLEERVRFVGRRLGVVFLLLVFNGWIRKRGGKLLPEALRDRVKWVSITWF